MTDVVGDRAIQVLLGVLALYHLSMGALALLAPRIAWRSVRSLYGAALGEGSDASGMLQYATSMIGALALAVGGLVALAASAPARYVHVVAALLALQLARLLCRVRDRDLLMRHLQVSPRRNAAAIALLALECTMMAAWLWR